MNLSEMKELAFIIELIIILSPCLFYGLGYIFARITYKIHITRLNARKYVQLRKILIVR